MLYKVLLAFESIDETLSVTIQIKTIMNWAALITLYRVVLTSESMKAIKWVALLCMLCRPVDLTFESAEEVLKCVRKSVWYASIVKY